MDAVFYLRDALRLSPGESLEEIREISFEIGMLGRHGLDISGPKSIHVVRELPGRTFSALQIICIMYAGFKRIEPGMDVRGSWGRCGGWRRDSKDVRIMGQEPEILKKGKQFHQLVQAEWEKTAEGLIKTEKVMDRQKKNKGRADIFVKEIGENLVSIVEIKNTDWDNIKLENIHRNVKRQARQIWEYIEYQTDSEKISVSPGLIFPKIPKDPERLKLVESLFDQECIQVVWENESIDEVKKRLMGKPESE